MRRFSLVFTVVLGSLTAVVAMSAVGTLMVDTSSIPLTISSETVQTDPDVVVTLQGNSTSGNDKSENALTCPGIEASGNKPVVRNDWVRGDKQYALLVEEASADAWPAGTIYRAEVFGDSSPIATLYFWNEVAKRALEGVEVRVDLGSPTLTYGSYTTVVTRLTECP